MIELNGSSLALEQVEAVAVHGEKVGLCNYALSRVENCRRIVDQIILEGVPVYGISTGFGRLCNVTIPLLKLEQLQLNLVRSHCAGVGELLPKEEVRAMMLLRANVLAKGFSGVRPALIELLIDLLNEGVTPEIPSRGSVGASGDLAPLAHMALPLVGEGRCQYNGISYPSSDIYQMTGLEPLRLGAKEGLALINGTQALTSVGSLAVMRAFRLVHFADRVAAMTLEALGGLQTPYDARIHEARPHQGQMASAAALRGELAGSGTPAWRATNFGRVQDAYSLRCVPQVHGAVRGVIDHVRAVIEVETGSATDNPLIFEDGSVVSGGNFHGAPLAMAFDYAAIAITDLAGISERRLERLVNPDLSDGLTPFLASDPGLDSGMMIGHVTSVALLNEMKILSSPASIDNLPTSGGTEDHVSMGMTAALKLRKIVENAEYCLAIEAMAAAEGLDQRGLHRAAPRVRALHREIRSFVEPLLEDRVLSRDFEQLAKRIRFDEFSDPESDAHFAPETLELVGKSS